MLLLSAVEARVLGSLIEKESTTPEYYPMTLNALVNACNQKSSRDPVMSLDEMTVVHALARLRDNGIVEERSEAGSRVPRYAHKFERLVPSTPAEKAALCILLLRGPQTTGEIRGRSGRLHEFRDPAEVDSTLQALMTRPEPVVEKLGRMSGHKENRFRHLLGGTAEEGAAAVSPAAAPAAPKAPLVTPPADDARLAALEKKVDALRRDVDAIKERLSGALSPAEPN
jgi:hypothetical protein